ncbi:cyclic nucleotide-binding domain-containing protein [Listeria booriae]|uniref:cyclic nucleotide-binding domain-containing protein n=1 Tax=Listeria booriae TaxID=1552123 RepID=UPI00162653DC|nr:cyclic nucleotide-binding domain-containing protein [Listeria booriae]MBC2369838.1 cyclic nucleotide-binding domain-containing protein [Listeria booriae]
MKKRTILLHEDEVHEYLYIIQSGLCNTTKDGHIKSFLKEEVIGMNNILGNEVSSFTVTALTNMVLLNFAKEDVMLKLMHLHDGLFFLHNDMKLMNQHMVQRDVLHVVDTKERLKINIVYFGVLYGKEMQIQLVLYNNFDKR